MKISDLSSKMSLSNSTVSGIVDRLEKQDFVKRIRSKDDRRVVYVEVTSKLKKVGKAKRDRIEKSVQFIISSATPEEMDVIKKGLLTLEKVIDRKNKE
jgi:DNA-binding MarR family transcriptional regulator